MSSKKKVTEKKASAKTVTTTSIESTETTDTPQADYRPPYPGFIDRWEELTTAYDRVEQALDNILGNGCEPDEIFIALKALQQVNREHNALFNKGWNWLGNPETRKFFGCLTYEELQAENARKQAEQAGEHPIQ
jgi:hypothetical protein